MSDNIFLKNDYNVEWGSWTDWAISNKTDSLTPGFVNQYSAYAGSGAEGSETYALASAYAPVKANLLNENDFVNGLYLTNTTYTALSLRDGDAFAKAFGGVTGNDEDYFLLTIKKWFNGQLGDEKVEFYLADYRFEDNAKDYIVKAWQYVDLTELGRVDSLEFSLSSSDVGDFGMNTPAYFCIDNVATSTTVANHNIVEHKLEITPNPSHDFLQIQDLEEEISKYQIYDSSGRLMLSSNNYKDQIDIRTLPEGYFLIAVETDHNKYTIPFIKG